MSHPTIDLLGIPIAHLSHRELLGKADEFLRNSEPHFFMAMNPIKIVRALRVPEFQHIIERADLIFADAVGISWGARLLMGKKLQHYPGIDLMHDLLQLANENGYRAYFVGTSDEVLRRATNVIQQRYPRAQIVGSHHGFFSEEDAATIISELQRTHPHLLFVGMGAFLQERWILRFLERVDIPFCMGVGGSFDVIANAAPRGPRWLIELGLEWLYRLIRQPKRIVPMMALPQFAYLVMREKLRRRGTP